jgi:hypothetical protein
MLMIGDASLFERELSHAVVRLLHVTVAIHLQNIAELLVDEQSANGKVSAIRHREQALRIAALD